MTSVAMTITFAFILLFAALACVCGWEEFGLRVPANVQPPSNRKRRMSSIWDEPRRRRQRIYKIREELGYESSLKYESFVEMAPLSLSMSMIPSLRPTTSPVYPEPPPLGTPTVSPIFPGPSSRPVSTPTAVPSDEPTSSPVQVEPPTLVIPTQVPSDEPTTSPVQVEPPSLVIPTEVPSDEPSTSPVHAEPPPLVIPTEVPSEEPTASPLHVEPPPLVIPTAMPSEEPTSLQITPTVSMVPTIQTHETSMEPSETISPTEPTPPVALPTSPAPTLTPSVTQSQEPSGSSSPTVSQSPTTSIFPSSRPSASWAPTLSPSLTPSQTPSVSLLPTMSPRPSLSAVPTIQPSISLVPTRTASPSLTSTSFPSSQSQVPATLAYDCLENDIISLGEATDENTTGITLFVGYHVESSSNSTNDFLADLEQTLLLTAVAAALGCNRPDLRRRHLMETPSRKLLQSSTIIDSVPCNTTVEGAVSCTTIETDLVFFLKGEVDPDRAAFSGYSAIRDKMTNDEYIGKIPAVLKLIYKSPLPLPAPPQVIEDKGKTNNENFSNLNARDAKLRVSSWTIGACVASVFGGTVSLLVWSRNRRSRHLRHVQLVDDCSMVETSSRNPISV